MAKMFAFRTIRLCTKDCLCLYVCPTGATDTENSIIDVEKCIGCGACSKACPSSAISLVPKEMPPQQPKRIEVISVLRELIKSKADQETIAAELAKKSGNKLAIALEKSNRIMAEDLCREAGYMLPQSSNTNAFLNMILKNPQGEGFPASAAEELLGLLAVNDAPKNNSNNSEDSVEKWKCSVCGYVHNGPLPKDFVCPRCKQPASAFARVDESTK